ncbi:MAG: lipid A export permease/ATP-binding protein MsbA [Betaproteobacteria bacterium RIFCSPLOWO2_02_FULL_67_26]|nr:MAG: lipid A export permease/ATP-binding protein MsbA [Betaproteobacteria bacterium RIFCSPLOWO2_02_FULL_67_26]
MSNSALYLRLLSHVKPHWRVFALGVLGMAAVAATEPMLPALLKPLIEGTFIEKDPVLIRWMPVAIVVLFAVRGAAAFVAAYSLGWVGNRLVTDLRNAMFAKLLALPAPFYDEQPAGGLISKLTFDATQVTAAATSALTIVFRDTLAIVGLLAYLLWLNWKLTLFALVMAPLIVLVVRVLSVRLRNSSREVQQAMGYITQVIEEAIGAHKVVKLFGGQEYEKRRFGEESDRVRRHLMKQVAAVAASAPIVQLIAAVALAVIVHYAMLQSSAAQLSVGEFAAFVAGMLLLTAPLKRITDINEYLQKGLAAAESVFRLMDQAEEPDRGTVAIGRARGEIRFEDVSFSYGDPGRLALDSVSLAIAPGETVALVGASGAGKTTLANLVPRFYHPTRGRVRLDGHDLEALTLASLRANIALVSQDVVLFNDTVAANIAYGMMNGAAERDIIAAAEAAHAMEFIREMAQGLATLVGENGLKLSGGQRQRLAIARALLKNAPVLVLDEATSALDTESERHVQAALEALMRGRTTIVIAHRLSTVEKADRIVALDRGRIAETGTHRELLARGGIYDKLYRIQFAPSG